MNIGRVLRIGGAVALLVTGLVHLDLYFSGYRYAGSEPTFGRSILAKAIASAVVATAVAARREWFVRLTGIVLPASTLAVLAYTHSGHTFLGFESHGLNPSPQAQIALITEIAAIVLLACTFIPSISASDASSAVGFLGASACVAAVAFVVFGLYWADHYETTTAAAAPASVTIANFAFAPQTVTVPPGTTVTWTSNDSVPHSVAANDLSFVSDELASGTTFEFTFDTPGEYPYVCGIHPSMSGVVSVTD